MLKMRMVSVSNSKISIEAVPKWTELSHVRWKCQYHIVFIPEIQEESTVWKVEKQM